jgi:recombinational DNA repair ATPase RecF
MNGEGVRTPGWFITAIATASVLIAVGWTVSEFRNREIAELQKEISAARQELAQADAHQDIEVRQLRDSMQDIRWDVKANTYRLCLIERKLSLPLNQRCAGYAGLYRGTP